MFPKRSDFNPDYRIRISKRARRILIKVLPNGMVEVVLPQGVSEDRARQLLHDRRDWLTDALQKVSHQAELNPQTHSLRPDIITLLAVEQQWSVDYQQAQQNVKVDVKRQQLILPANESQKKTAERLRQWLQRYAKTVLPEWLEQVRDETGHRLNKISVRGQKTRWGSYSSAGNVNLNRNLLFVPADTVRYLFIHELSHSVHMNHSRAFWAEVKKHQCDYQQHEKILNEAARSLPAWVYS